MCSVSFASSFLFLFFSSYTASQRLYNYTRWKLNVRDNNSCSWGKRCQRNGFLCSRRVRTEEIHICFPSCHWNRFAASRHSRIRGTPVSLLTNSGLSPRSGSVVNQSEWATFRTLRAIHGACASFVHPFLYIRFPKYLSMFGP